jgi:hypothetical protein
MGHSGDVIESWASLQFQPMFTATAANVAFGYWSHDLGGHRPAATADISFDAELYLRWLQWGVFAPTLRAHMEHGKASEQPPRVEDAWRFAEPYASAMADALRLRARLVPYIYTAALQTYFTGVSIVHPLYFDYAADPIVYDYATQFLFGDDLLVAPILTPRDQTINLTNHSMYLPEGQWVEMGSLRCLSGRQTVTAGYTQSELGGAFVKAGSIIPMALEPTRLHDSSIVGSDSPDPDDGAAIDGRHPLLGGAQEIPRTLVWEAYIGNATTGNGLVMEDDASGNAYMDRNATTAAIATTTANYTVDASGQSFRFQIGGTVGSYAGMPSVRNYEVRLRGAWAPTSVTVTFGSTSTEIPAHANHLPRNSCGKLRCGGDHTAPAAAWWWDAQSMTAFARLDNTAVAAGATIHFTFNTTLHHVLLHSPHRTEALPIVTSRALAMKYAVDAEFWKGVLPSNALNRLAATADRMQINPNTAVTELAGLREQLQTVIQLHTKPAPRGKAGPLPTGGLQKVLTAWLSLL